MFWRGQLPLNLHGNWRSLLWVPPLPPLAINANCFARKFFFRRQKFMAAPFSPFPTVNFPLELRYWSWGFTILSKSVTGWDSSGSTQMSNSILCPLAPVLNYFYARRSNLWFVTWCTCHLKCCIYVVLVKCLLRKNDFSLLRKRTLYVFCNSSFSIQKTLHLQFCSTPSPFFFSVFLLGLFLSALHESLVTTVSKLFACWCHYK